MKNSEDIQSSGSALCILEDGMGKPLHMQIIEDTPEQYHNFCRDEAAHALLKHSSEVLSYKIHRFRIQNENLLPDKDSVKSKNDLDRLLDKSASIEKGIKYSYSSPLREYIDEMIRAVPQEYLWSHYAISGTCSLNMDYVENFCVGNSQFLCDVLHYNNYTEFNLIETPHGSWLYDCSSQGFRGMIDFSNFLERNFFNPQIDFDEILRSSVWINCSHRPAEINDCTPEFFDGNLMLPGGHINPDKYFVRENSMILDFRPTPENYWKNFIAGWSEVAIPSMSNNIATLLFFEQKGGAPEECLNLFLRSAFAEQYNEFTSEIVNMKNAKDKSDNLVKLKTMATQIISENEFDIRGREKTQPLSENTAHQLNDFFLTRFSGSRHI